MLLRARTTLAVVIATLTLLTSCAGGTAERPHDAVPAGASAPRPQITKILVFVVENHSLSQMRTRMPRVYRLATRFAYASRYHALVHPSLPNYIAMVSGSTYGVRDDHPPARHRLRGRTVFGQALAHHKTAAIYADSMRRRCQLRNAGRYAVRHNPWTYFVDERAACRAHDVPISELRADIRGGTLPNVGFVIPDVVHDAHNASLGVADRWIARRIREIRTGRDWASGHLAVVVTADEDDRHHGNRVLTVVASRYQARKVVRVRLDHYSLTRAIDDILDVPRLKAARHARSLTRAFGMPN